MSAAAVGRTGQAARLFMIGSEEEQEEVAPDRPPARPTRKGRCSSQVLWGKALDGKNLMPVRRSERER